MAAGKKRIIAGLLLAVALALAITGAVVGKSKAEQRCMNDVDAMYGTADYSDDKSREFMVQGLPYWIAGTLSASAGVVLLLGAGRKAEAETNTVAKVWQS